MHDDATSSMTESWNEILAALMAFENDLNEKAREATGRRRQLERLETCFVSVFGEFVLKRLIAPAKLLRSVDIGVDTAVELYDSPIRHCEKQALSKSVTQAYECQNRREKTNSGTEQKTGETPTSHNKNS